MAGPASLARPKGGAAMGLRFVRSLAAAMSGTLAAVSLAGCGSAPRGRPGPGLARGPHLTHGAPSVRPVLAYVLGIPPCMGTTVSRVNVTTGKALRPVTVGRGASSMVITPDGATVYVASGLNNTNGTVCPAVGPQRAASIVTPIATATGKAGTPIRAGQNPGPMAITPDGKTVYVVSTASRLVIPVRVATGTALRPIRLADRGTAIAITPDGKTAYVIGPGAPSPGPHGTGLITPIRTATNTALRPVKVDGDPSAIAVTPDGETAYVLTSTAVVPITTATNTAGTPIKVGAWPGQIVISPDGATAYVTSSLGVVPISTAGDTAGQPITANTGPIAITPDGKTVYVAGYDHSARADSVTPISTATNTPSRPILLHSPGGTDISGIGITPDGRTVYLLNAVSEPGSAPGTIIPISVATNAVGAPIRVGTGPATIVFGPAR
jgi:DNA-binding beta-propeller fold protein YncE